MAKELEFYFDVVSPAAYLAWTQLEALRDDTGATLVCKPMLLTGVFKASGNSPPLMVPAKGKWMMQDLTRFATHYGVPMHLNPYFPINTLLLMRGAVAIQEQQPERFSAYVDAAFRAIWVDQKNMGDAAVVAEVLTQAGFDAEALLQQCAEQGIKDKLKANTDEAVARGAFGAPTFFVGDEMFFGQDRSDFIKRALLA